MARRTRRRDSDIPKAPFDYGQTVKVKLADGAVKVGTISLVAWLLFPGAHSFEVNIDGESYRTHGGGMTDRPGIVALTDDMEEEL